MKRDDIADQARSDGGMFAVIPSVVMQDPELSMSAKMLYGIITWRCNKTAYCWATNRTLGEDLGLSSKRVSSLVSDLEDRGHIETEIITDEETGAVKYRYIYPVVKSSRCTRTEPCPIPKNGDTPPPEDGDTYSQTQAYPPPENAEDIYEKRKEETKSEEEPLKPPLQGGKGKKCSSRYALAEDAKPLLREYCGEDRELAVALGRFIELRTTLRAVNSRAGIAALLSKLDRLSGGNRGLKLELIQEAMANSWKSVFPLRGPRAAPAGDGRVVETEATYEL